MLNPAKPGQVGFPTLTPPYSSPADLFPLPLILPLSVLLYKASFSIRNVLGCPCPPSKTPCVTHILPPSPQFLQRGDIPQAHPQYFALSQLRFSQCISMSFSPTRLWAPEGKKLSYSVLYLLLKHCALYSVNMGKWMHDLQIAWPLSDIHLASSTEQWTVSLLRESKACIIGYKLLFIHQTLLRYSSSGKPSLPDLYHVLSLYLCADCILIPTSIPAFLMLNSHMIACSSGWYRVWIY